MTDKELFNQVSNELYKTGSCTPNQWQFMVIVDGDKKAAFEAMQPSRGNIRIRKPIQKMSKNGYGEQIYLYSVYRFTNKIKLIDDGMMEDAPANNIKEKVNQLS